MANGNVANVVIRLRNRPQWLLFFSDNYFYARDGLTADKKLLVCDLDHLAPFRENYVHH